MFVSNIVGAGVAATLEGSGVGGIVFIYKVGGRVAGTAIVGSGTDAASVGLKVAESGWSLVGASVVGASVVGASVVGASEVGASVDGASVSTGGAGNSVTGAATGATLGVSVSVVLLESGFSCAIT